MKPSNLAIILVAVSLSAQANGPVLVPILPDSNRNYDLLPPIPTISVYNAPARVTQQQQQVGSQNDTEWMLKCIGDGMYQDTYQPELKQAYCKGYMRGYRRHETKMRE